MALCIARKAGDKQMEKRALDILASNDLHSVDDYIGYVRKQVPPQQIADSLENCLKG